MIQCLIQTQRQSLYCDEGVLLQEPTESSQFSGYSWMKEPLNLFWENFGKDLWLLIGNESYPFVQQK